MTGVQTCALPIYCDSRLVITADGGCRGGKAVPLKANVDAALAQDGVAVDHVVVVRHSGTDVAMTEGRDLWLDEALAAASEECAPEPMAAEDPLFILYTSGSTGKPKGVGVTHANILYFLEIMQRRFGIVPEDRFSQTFAQTFDVSVWDLFMAWEYGASV